MKRIWPLVVPGIIMVLVGLVWTLQGFNILGGSPMSGSSIWATIGPIVLVIGVILIVVAGVMRSRGRTR